ncbi:hypothetical protein AOQ84DRAFT_343131 [Glonium stellatum]|uniref:Zn(2)-C6 fungal-type domain-containing protein n=1 Tax=Glonium stellatum TaxID=574774 RepID=A0A8E2EX72_9PEZI|nr:hypothetical protein AOQ84DRAFT_343131 [Glonium stellatum]
MSGSSVTPIREHRRKRVRKGTRSCWECRRRKIKCIYQSDDHSICVSCLDKGTTCLSQEYVDDQSPHDAGNSALDQRMGKVEALLEKLMEKVSQATEENRTPYGPVDVLTPSSTPATTHDSQPPFISLFDDVLGQQAEANVSMPPPQSVSASNSSTPANAGKGRPIGRTEKLRRRLAAMLPCQEDVDHLSELSSGWWLIRRHIMPHLLRIPEDDLQNPFDVSTVSVSQPMIIARLLLCVAICIQQLPPNIDPRGLQTKVPLREMIEKIITFVTAAVTSDDELIGNLEGIECLVLQGVYHVNAGNLRRSWLAFRRAINVAQLMGLHRMSLKASQEVPDLMETRRRYMWYQIVRGERYLSLILGVPSATGSAPFPCYNHAPWISTEDLYNKHLCDISGLILARNQGDAIHAFSTTLEIDQKLDSLAKQMPRTWWEIPTSLIEDRTEEAASQFERLICQIWHFELQTLVNLPFMLRAATDRRYEYFRVSCLSASRGLIRTWMCMREAHGTTFVNNLVEFQAFTAAITLLLGLLGPTCITTDPVILKGRHEDMQLVQTVVEILEGLKRHGTGVHVVNQSISVIRTLQGVLRDEGSSSGNLRLSIPHFGTISVARGGAVQSLEGERILGANPRSDVMSMEVNPSLQARRSNSTPSTNGAEPTLASMSVPKSQQYQAVNDDGEAMDGNGAWMENTVLQFTSSQFPMFETQTSNSVTEWPFQESDTMFFDSLLNTDVEGNWDF